MTLRSAFVALIALAASVIPVQAQLSPRLGGEAVFDADRGFTVLANANLPQSERFGLTGINLDGSMNWITAKAWIDQLNAANYLGFNDWRLPDGRDDGLSYCNSGIDCADGELYHLWLELGGPDVDGGGGDITDSSDPDLALFYNFPSEYYKFYWESTTASRGRAWTYSFGTRGGTRHRVYDRETVTFVFVWPVRTGDVGPQETAGDAGFHNVLSKAEYSWPDQSGTTTYEVARSDFADFSGACQYQETADLQVDDPEAPPAGQAFFFLTRPLEPTPGSWGWQSDGLERQGSCL